MKRYMLALMLVGISTHGTYQETPLSFDELFPVSTVQKMVALTALLADDVVTLQHTHNDYEYAMLHDMVIGRIVRLQYRFYALMHDYNQGASLLISDVEYLATRLEHVNALYQQIATEETQLAASMLADTVCSLNQLLNP